MEIKGNTVLITGGATGIGFGLAKSFSELGNEVIICGRRDDRLKEAKTSIPGINTKRCDISIEDDRQYLYNWISAEFRDINILINNAGIQKFTDFKKVTDDKVEDEEVDTNLKAPINLVSHFVPIFLKQKQAAIVNISSGLGFVPMARYPIYSATKAAVHSFSVSLRHQLKDTSVSVFEIILPGVKDTELKRKQGVVMDRGMMTSEAIPLILDALKNDTYEAAIGDEAKFLFSNSRSDPEGAFKRINQ